LKVNAPIQEQVGLGWTPGWSNFFTQLVQAIGWVKGWSFRFVLDFGSIPANSQSSGLTVTINGARQGDCVHVTPYGETVGITYKALVTADNTVTIYAINFTAGAINPPSMQYRVVVIQN
jgi:hypothetical protein